MNAGIPAEPGHLAFGELFDGVSQFFHHLFITDLSGQIPGEIFILQAELDHELFADAFLQQGADLVHHALLQPLFQPLIDSLFQDFPGPGDPELEQFKARCFSGGAVIVRFQFFEHPHDAVAVAGINLRIGQFLFQHLIQLRRSEGFQMRPQAMVRRPIAEIIAVRDSVHIQAGTADQEGKAAAGKNAVDRLIGEALEIRHGKELSGRAHVQQVMGNALHFFRRDFAGTEIKPAEHLAGIGGDDFAVETGGEFHTQGALSGCVGSLNHNQLGKHAFTSFNTLKKMISQGFEGCKGAVFPEFGPKTAYFVCKMPQRVQNKAFQEKKYLTEDLEWLY